MIATRPVVLGMFCATGIALATCATARKAEPLHPPIPPAPLVPPLAPCPPPETGVRIDGDARQGGVIRGRLEGVPTAFTLDGKAVPLAPDGRFLIGLDRDAPSSVTLSVTWSGGCGTVARTIAVAPGNWDIQSVNASITGSATSEAFKALRAGELERIAAARAAMTPGSSEGWRQDFIWPVAARISGRFGSQRIYRGTPGSYHGGVDLAAPAGTTYVAPADGVVILAASAPYTLEGNLLIIDHGMGLNSAFLHSQRLLVREGEVVRRGQPIGFVGATGRATGPHLHWGMKRGDARIDPVNLVAP